MQRRCCKAAARAVWERVHFEAPPPLPPCHQLPTARTACCPALLQDTPADYGQPGYAIAVVMPAALAAAGAMQRQAAAATHLAYGCPASVPPVALVCRGHTTAWVPSAAPLTPWPAHPTCYAGRPKPKAREMRGYTRAEVAQHRSEDDLWLIIKNKGSDKYKVPAWQHQHSHVQPGVWVQRVRAGGDQASRLAVERGACCSLPISSRHAFRL